MGCVRWVKRGKGRVREGGMRGVKGGGRAADPLLRFETEEALERTQVVRGREEARRRVEKG